VYRSLPKGSLGAVLGGLGDSTARYSMDKHANAREKMHQARDSVSEVLSAARDKGSPGIEPGSDEYDDDYGDRRSEHAPVVRHIYVFDEWLVTGRGAEKAVDVFGEEARLPILFFMLIKILAQGSVACPICCVVRVCACACVRLWTGACVSDASSIFHS
jgi:hypothetical protein